jgi:hypothetical protein
MKQKIQKIIENSARKSRKQKKEFLLFGRVMVYIQDPLVSDAVNFEDIIIQLEEFVPPHLFDGIDLIYVGHFQDLFDRELEATYENAAILITNTLANNIDYIENIVHETGHALESNNEGHGAEHIDEMEPEYQEEMDKFLYQELGYESLNYLINGLFLNPYAVTSLREYFASGIEKYLLSADDRKYLKILSPKLIEKIEELINGY